MSTVERQVGQRLAESGIRFTTSRRTVVGALGRGDGPRSAAELHGDLGGAVPLSSLYRSLAVLEDAGVLSPHHGTRGLTRYELAEWLTGHHHHLTCVECGAVDDVHLSPAGEQSLERVVDGITEAAGFGPTAHTLDIEGVCVRCR